MDFTPFNTDRYGAFADEVAAFIAENWDDERRVAAYSDGEEHDPEFLRALGGRGWIMAEWPAAEGGADLDWVQRFILNADLAISHTPSLDWAMTRMVAPTVRELGSDELRTEVLPRVTAGEAGICLGYTEPEGGSDIAAARTRAQRDGGGWVINGSKVFTTGAHHPGYCFLLTLTDPDAPPRRGLTTFLVPLDTPGVEVSGLQTLSERTNVVLYADVRLDDRYRLGPVDAGWQTLMGPLAAEHGQGGDDRRPLLDPGQLYSRHLAGAVDAAVQWSRSARPDGSRPADDPLVQARIGAAVVALAEGSVVWGTSGRVAGSDRLITAVADLVDLMAPDSLALGDQPGGVVENVHRAAQVSATYGGTTEVFRNLIARELGLPRPAHLPG